MQDLKEQFEKLKEKEKEQSRSNRKFYYTEILETFKDWQDFVQSTRQIADKLDASRSTIFKRLQELEEAGAIVSYDLGNVKAWQVGSHYSGTAHYSETVMRSVEELIE